MCRNLSGNTAENDVGTLTEQSVRRKHALKTSPQFTASGESLAVEFIVIKHFG